MYTLDGLRSWPSRAWTHKVHSFLSKVDGNNCFSTSGSCLRWVVPAGVPSALAVGGGVSANNWFCHRKGVGEGVIFIILSIILIILRMSFLPPSFRPPSSLKSVLDRICSCVAQCRTVDVIFKSHSSNQPQYLGNCRDNRTIESK